MNQAKVLIGGIAVIAVLVFVGLNLTGPDTGTEKPEDNPAPVALPIDSNQVRTQAESSLSIETVAADPDLGGYWRLIVLADDSNSSAAVLNTLYGQPVTGISLELKGEVNSHPDFDPVTLAAWNVKKGHSQNQQPVVDFESRQVFSGPLTPYIAANRLGQATFSLSINFETADIGIQKADGFARFDVSPAMGGKAVVFKTKSGETAGKVVVTFERRPSLFAEKLKAQGTLALSDILNATLPNGGSLKDHIEPSLAGLWAVSDVPFESACIAVRKALSEDAGLVPEDTAAALWAITRRHALFAEDINYETACADAKVARGLEALELDLPTPQKPATALSTMDLNQHLGRISSLARSSEPEGALEKLAVLFDQRVTLIDPYGILEALDANGALIAGNVMVHPETDGALASEYLASLPIDKFACFSQGAGMAGSHRAALVNLKGDPSIWVLDVAFTSQGEVEGVALKQADKASICQAIGSRTTPESQCYFSQNGPYKPSDCR